MLKRALAQVFQLLPLCLPRSLSDDKIPARQKNLEKLASSLFDAFVCGLEPVDQIIQTIDEALNKKASAFRQEANFKRKFIRT